MSKRNRFASTESVRLPLSDGDWIEIKEELSAKDARESFGQVVREYDKDGMPVLDPEKVGFPRVMAYLLDWSFTDADGKPVAVSAAAVNALTYDDYNEIQKAITAHETAREAARSKNATDGDGNSAATSTSV